MRDCRHPRILSLLLVGALVLSPASCGSRVRGETGAPSSRAGARSAEVPSAEPPVQRLELSPAEADYVESLRKRGSLRVAINNEQTVYQEYEDGRIDGLHYQLVLELCELLDLEVEFFPVLVPQFFSLEGSFPEQVKSDPDFNYTPDLLQRVDFYAGTFTSLPWRSKFLRFIPVYFTRLIFISRRGEEIHEPADLAGKRIALIPQTSYEEWVQEYAGEGVSQITVVEPATGKESIRMVAEGAADVTVADANLAIIQIREFSNLNVTIASHQLEELNWAVPRENSRLATILEKFIRLIRVNGLFESLWLDTYGISTVDYLDLIGISESVE